MKHSEIIHVFLIAICTFVGTGDATGQGKRKILMCALETKFTYDNHVCTCNEHGTEIICEKKPRVKSMIDPPELHQNQLQNVTVECEPKQYLRHMCSGCICDESGNHAFCVYDGCEKDETKREDPNDCSPGSVFHQVCNGCICGSNKKAACTKLDCKALLSKTIGPDYQCVPRSSLMFRCNECSCKEDGESMDCTKMNCLPMSFYHQHILNVTMDCDAHKPFQYNCHECICSKFGKFAMCSGVKCSKKVDSSIIWRKNTVDDCDPGTIFNKHCNVCVCNNEGKGTCTTLNCKLDHQIRLAHNID